jgi:hypothetical protein
MFECVNENGSVCVCVGGGGENVCVCVCVCVCSPHRFYLFPIVFVVFLQIADILTLP